MKQIIKKIIKISIFSLIFILGFLTINSFAENNSNINKIITNPSNNANYKNIVINPLSTAGVAITTNIGIKNSKTKISQTNINNKIFKAEDFYINSEKLKNELIKKNMFFTKEYYIILNINFSKTLQNSKNKQKTLNNILRQLKIRFKNANTNLKTLYKQKEILIQEYEKINTQIENLKRKLEKDFYNNKTKEVFKAVDNYYSLKEKQIILKTNIIFINNFIKKYNILNKYNSKLINTLELNKDIISKNSYLVIPNSGTKLLKDFNLLFSEEEFKNKKQ